MLSTFPKPHHATATSPDSTPACSRLSASCRCAHRYTHRQPTVTRTVRLPVCDLPFRLPLQTECLVPGTHSIELRDKWGDGWHGGYVELLQDGARIGSQLSLSGAYSLSTFDVVNPPPPPPPPPCQSWCSRNANTWAVKCTYATQCAGCAECYISPPPPPPPPPSPQPPCQSWCAGNTKDWATKCGYASSCSGCGECFISPSPPPPPPCKAWCAGNAKPWATKCGYESSCAGCPECGTDRR